MAESAGGLRERLCDAYQKQIVHVTDDNVPEDVRSDLAKLNRMLNHRPARHSKEGRCKATTDQMTDDEANAAARLMMQLFDQIEGLYWEEIYSHK